MNKYLWIQRSLLGRAFYSFTIDGCCVTGSAFNQHWIRALNNSRPEIMCGWKIWILISLCIKIQTKVYNVASKKKCVVNKVLCHYLHVPVKKTSESYEQFSFSFSDNKFLEFYWEKDIKNLNCST